MHIISKCFHRVAVTAIRTKDRQPDAKRHFHLSGSVSGKPLAGLSPANTFVANNYCNSLCNNILLGGVKRATPTGQREDYAADNRHAHPVRHRQSMDSRNPAMAMPPCLCPMCITLQSVNMRGRSPYTFLPFFVAMLLPSRPALCLPGGDKVMILKAPARAELEACPE